MISPILPLYTRASVKFAYGRGMYLYDENENSYLDMASGYAANSFGHCHPRLVNALVRQAERFWHLSNRFEIPGMYEYSKKLVDNTFADSVYIANTGAEAVESAIKFARKYFKSKGQGHRYRIITAAGAFHGRTLACSTASSEEKIKGFEPAVDGFDRVAFNDIEAFKKAIGPNTMAVMLEPIQGEGGMRPHTLEYMKEVERIAKENGMLLIFDEVQSGAGRTGWFCAYEMYGISADLVALAKGIGGGFPVSACLMTKDIAQAIEHGTHGSTFGGNPLAIAVANEVIDMMLEPGFLERVKEMGAYLKAGLIDIMQKFPNKIVEVRGEGLMLGLKMHESVDASKLINELLSNRLLSIPASENVVRITPPLIIEKEHCDKCFDMLNSLFAA